MLLNASSISGYLNLNPASSRRRGITRCLFSKTEPNSPRINLIIKPGAGMKDGRCKILPMAFPKSTFRTGWGEQRFTAPFISVCASKKINASARSCMCTQENHCFPLPKGPPRKNLNNGIICPSVMSIKNCHFDRREKSKISQS